MVVGLQDAATVPGTPLPAVHKVVRPPWRHRRRQDVEAEDGYRVPKKVCRLPSPAQVVSGEGLAGNRYAALRGAGDIVYEVEEVEVGGLLQGNAQGMLRGVCFWLRFC